MTFSTRALRAGTLGDRQILARFIFTGTGKRFWIEQAFSGDARCTWEVN
ncbi:MAG: hypothetical protein JWO25_2816 [Alphaproteobacteria bacterium]|nr:hypothetical protein [Alphaproteobacteria bacterium]